METSELENEFGTGKVFERDSVEYEDLSQLFITESGNYSKQFAKIYTARLSELSKVLAEKCRTKWSEDFQNFFNEYFTVLQPICHDDFYSVRYVYKRFYKNIEIRNNKSNIFLTWSQ